MTYLDNDKLHKPVTGSSEVYTLSDSVGPLTEEQLVKKLFSVRELVDWKGNIIFDSIAR